MLGFTWDTDHPPLAPPAECHNPALWAEMRRVWGGHQPDERGQRCRCPRKRR